MLFVSVTPSISVVALHMAASAAVCTNLSVISRVQKEQDSFKPTCVHAGFKTFMCVFHLNPRLKSAFCTIWVVSAYVLKKKKKKTDGG